MDEDNEKKVRLWGMLCHLAAISVYIGMPFGHILGPLIIWLIKRNESPFIDKQGKEALNFQISMTIYGIISAILCYVFIGCLFLIFLFTSDIILLSRASIKASNGEYYRYPFTIRFLK